MPSQMQKARDRLEKQGLTVLIILLPFGLFFWLLPFLSDLTFGTDYINYHIHHHLDMMFSIKSGSFPLFAPECFYGQSSAAYTQAQIYHPLSYLAAILPGYWQGLSLEWLTLLRLLTLAVCHLAVFRLLTGLALSRWPAFLLSLIAVYNLRLLVLFWHGSALEAYTGFLFLVVSSGVYLRSPTPCKGPLTIIFSTYWLLVSGYPPMVYFAVMGGVVFLLIFPFFAQTVSPQQTLTWPEIRKFWFKAGGFMMIGGGLSAAYLCPFFFDFMSNNVGRAQQPYLWSIELNDMPVGLINNFIYPLKSALGMFAGSPLFLVAVCVPVLRLFRYKLPASIWSLIFAVTLVLAYMQGGRTPVHFWVWQYLPFAAAIRVPGYAALMLPLFLVMILAWLLTASPLVLNFKKRLQLPVIVVPVFLSFLLMMGYLGLPDHILANAHFACPVNIRSIPAWVQPTIMISNFFILATMGLTYCKRSRLTGPGAMILLMLTFLQLLIFFRQAPFALAEKPNIPTYQAIKAEKRASINFQEAFYLNGMVGSEVVVTQLKKYFMEPKLGTVYREVLWADSQTAAYQLLNTKRNSHQVVIENFPKDQISQMAFNQTGRHADDQVKLAYSAYNRLVFQVQACCPSFFVCAYPHSGHWQTRVNHQSVPIYRANGAAQAVFIKPGTSFVEFRYWSWPAFYGMLISCLTLALAGGYFALKGTSASGPLRYGLAALAFFVAGGIFFFWFHSLYTGQNLQTQYRWQSSQRQSPANIAFGKPTQMSGHRKNYPYRYNSRHAVDGDIAASSCFLTAKGENPWWMVDLKQERSLGEIRMVSTFSRRGFNKTPLILEISSDGVVWETIQIGSPTSKSPILLVRLEKHQTARFIKIQSLGHCVLAFNEILIYSPSP